MSDLIGMKVMVAFGKWFPGMIAGFPADQAKVIASRGLAVYLEEPAVEPEPAPAQTEDVVIPEDWDQQHHMKIIALAKSIAGDAAPTPLTLDAAKSIITDELAQRAETKGT